MTMIKNFLRSDAGAVTIDWVALTAGILLLGLTVVGFIFQNGVTSLTQTINSSLENAEVPTLDLEGTGG